MTFKYCSGCSHSQLHLLLARVLGERPEGERLLGVSGTGCSEGMGQYFNVPFVSAAAGQAPAVAAGIKRSRADHLVFTYQGDGDLAARGLDTLMSVAARRESITVICLNNLVMAGSGGQMSPTSLTGQVTTSTRLGRSYSRMGKPLKLTETVARMPGVAFAQRVALHKPSAVEQARLALEDAFAFQKNVQGLSFIEVLGWCPPYWDCTPVEARQRLENQVFKVFPLGIFRNEGLKV